MVAVLTRRVTKTIKLNGESKIKLPIVVRRISDSSIKNVGADGTPEEMLITQVIPMWNDTAYITYFNPKTKIYSNRYESFEDNFLVLSGKERSSAIAKFNTYKKNNINKFLSDSMWNNIGSDPEIFLERGDGSILPAFEFLGSKEKSTTKSELYGDKVYWDGWQAEFEAKSSYCLAYHLDAVQDSLRALINAASVVDDEAKFSAKTLIEIPMDVLTSTPPEFVAFGCHPSLNAYGIPRNNLRGEQVPFRSTGGHIHIGLNFKSDSSKEEQANSLVKALDAILGVCCVSLLERFDNPIRRRFYGRPGEYRMPKYGIEYRVLSGAIFFHPMITNLVFDLARGSTALWAADCAHLFKATEQEVINTIMTCDVEQARKIMLRNKKLLLNLFTYIYYGYGQGSSEAAFKVFFEGMHNIIHDPTDIIGNWDLDNEWESHCENDFKNWKSSYTRVGAGLKI